eukprot:2760718-Amphidinium_carterae.1
MEDDVLQETAASSGTAAASSSSTAASSGLAMALGSEVLAPMQDEQDVDEPAAKVARTAAIIAQAEEADAEIFEVLADPDPVFTQACYCDVTGHELAEEEARQWDADEMSKVQRAKTY